MDGTVTAVKGNQPTLHQGLVDFFHDHFDDDFARTEARRHRSSNKGHGREEFRMYVICPVPEDLPDRERWADLKAIGVAMNIVYRDGKACSESRYYILSRKLTAKRFAEAVRSRWGIENNLHWQLDVTF